MDNTKQQNSTEPANCGNTVLGAVIVYEFMYNDCCHESAPHTMSIHHTKKGAEMAMEFHKNEMRKDWEKECKEYPPAKDYPYDSHKWWGVRETVVQS